MPTEDEPRSGSDPVVHPATQRVVEHAARCGVAISPQRYPEGTRTANDAADAVGADISQIVKSLVFLVDGLPMLALVSGVNQLDPTKLAKAAGGGTVTRADAERVRAATGFAIGGVAPFGSREPLPVFIDRTLLQHDVVYAAGGTPEVVFGISPKNLVKASGAISWDLAAAD